MTRCYRTLHKFWIFALSTRTVGLHHWRHSYLPYITAGYQKSIKGPPCGTASSHSSLFRLGSHSPTTTYLPPTRLTPTSPLRRLHQITPHFAAATALARPPASVVAHPPRQDDSCHLLWHGTVSEGGQCHRCSASASCNHRAHRHAHSCGGAAETDDRHLGVLAGHVSCGGVCASRGRARARARRAPAGRARCSVT